MNSKKTILRIFVYFLIIYVILFLFLFFNQRSMIYFPNNQDFYDCHGFSDYEKINFNGTRFYFQNNSNDVVLIYYHGNAGSACDRSFTRKVFDKFNISFIFVEYAGYSNDIVRPSKNLILQDVRNINNFISKKEFTNIIVYGQSIGSGPASYQAFIGQVDTLILTTPFDKLSNVAQSIYPIFPMSFFLTENYNNLKWLERYENNIIIIHGDNDEVISHRFSKNLFNNLENTNKEYVLLSNVGHNNVWSSIEFKNTLTEYLKRKI